MEFEESEEEMDAWLPRLGEGMDNNDQMGFLKINMPELKMHNCGIYMIKLF